MRAYALQFIPEKMVYEDMMAYENMYITAMTATDFETFWPVLKSTIVAQETYALDPEMDFASARQLWHELPVKTVVAKNREHLLGSYYLKPNAAGPRACPSLN